MHWREYRLVSGSQSHPWMRAFGSGDPRLGIGTGALEGGVQPDSCCLWYVMN